jgi:purine-nucleoside phosphorylase
MATPHIGAEPGDFAPDVLMPGDPRRAARIAESFSDVRLVTEVRGILGYTGTVDGRPISVLASGMGMPSISIYATELFRFYGVRRIIRIGTAGGMAPHLKVGDVVIANAAHTDSATTALRIPGVHYSHAPSFALLRAAADAAPAEGRVHIGPVLSSDTFYSDADRSALVAHGTLAVEMEAAALYSCADREGGQALAICTISDLLFDSAALSSDERERLFDQAVSLGLAAFADV